MSQYVRRYALLDPNRFGSITHDPVELACGDGQEGIAPGKQPQPWPRHPPVVLQDRQQLTLEADANSRALDLLGQAIDRDPDHAFAVALSAWCMGQRVAPPFLFTNALAQDRRRLWLEATTVARRALTLRAGASELAILGNAFAITGNLGTAEVVTQKALSISGSSVWAWSRSGLIDVWKGSTASALDKLNIALDLSRDDPLTFNSLFGIALAHFQVGRYAEAARWMQRGIAENSWS